MSVHEVACEQCEYKSTLKALLKRHIETTHQRNIFSCDQCTHKALNSPDLKLHMDKHHQKKTKRLSCEVCEQKFNKIEIYEKHMMKVRGGRQENLITNSDQNLIQTTIPFQRKLRSLRRQSAL